MALKRFLSSFLIVLIPFVIIFKIFDSTTFWLVLSTFLLVFLLGLQSLTVNARKWALAPVVSLGISLCNLFLFKVVPDVDLNNINHVIAYLIGGPFGISYSMYIHFKILHKEN